MLRGALAVVVASAALAPPATVALPAEVVAFAQDGGRVAWVGGSCSEVHVRVLATGRESTVGRDLAGACQPYPVTLALAGSRALWTNQYGGNETYTDVATASAGDRQREVSGEYASDDLGPGDGTRVVAIAGDGPSLVYAVLAVREISDACFDGPDPCTFGLRSGFVMQVVGHVAHRLRTLPAASELAVARDTLALVPPESGVQTTPRLPPAHAVELWSLRSDARLAHVDLDASPAEVALDRTTLAVLVHRDGAPWVERFAVPSGRPLGSMRLAAGAADLSISSTATVYRTGRTIRVAGRPVPIGVASASPIGLSIESTRVAWAENVRGRGRIRILKLH